MSPESNRYHIYGLLNRNRTVIFKLLLSFCVNLGITYHKEAILATEHLRIFIARIYFKICATPPIGQRGNILKTLIKHLVSHNILV